jgi:hypothetical protein
MLIELRLAPLALLSSHQLNQSVGHLLAERCFTHIPKPESAVLVFVRDTHLCLLTCIIMRTV